MSLKIWIPVETTYANKGLDTNYDSPTTFPANPITGRGLFTGLKNTIVWNGSAASNNMIHYANTLSCEEDYTISCWVKANDLATSAQSGIVSNGYADDCGFVLLRTADNKFAIKAYGTTITSISTFEENRWYHIVAYIHRGTSDLRLYIDNEYQGETHIYGNIDNDDTIGFNIGAEAPTGCNTFIGKISDVRVYNHLLSAKEREDLSRGLYLHHKLSDRYIEYDEEHFGQEELPKSYDCSGNGYIGYCYGRIDVSDNIDGTGRYSANSTFNSNDTTDFIDIKAIVPDEFVNTYTFSWWMSTTTDTGNRVVFHSTYYGVKIDDTGRLAAMSKNSNEWTLFVKPNNDPVDINVYSDGTMHFYTIVSADSDLLLYIDGEYVGHTKQSEQLCGSDTYIVINGEGYREYTPWRVSMSDFRLYVTRLEDREIEDLYRVPAFVDKSGNFHTFELVEK